MPNRLINLDLPEQMLTRLKEEQDRTGLTRAALIRLYIQEGLDAARPRSARETQPTCAKCGRPWSRAVICAGGCSNGPLCEDCL
jgi:hypothetical protein